MINKIKAQVEELEFERKKLELQLEEVKSKLNSNSIRLETLRSVVKAMEEEEANTLPLFGKSNIPLSPKPNESMNFSTLLKTVLALRGELQQHLAEELGVSFQVISAWSKGRTLPKDKPKMAEKLTAYYGDYGIKGLWEKCISNSVEEAIRARRESYGE